MKWFPVFDSRSACSYMPPRAESAFRWMMSLSMNKMNGALNLSDHFPYLIFFFISISVFNLVGSLLSCVLRGQLRHIDKKKDSKGKRAGASQWDGCPVCCPTTRKVASKLKEGKKKRERGADCRLQGLRAQTPEQFSTPGAKITTVQVSLPLKAACNPSYLTRMEAAENKRQNESSTAARLPPLCSWPQLMVHVLCSRLLAIALSNRAGEACFESDIMSHSHKN